MNGLGCRESNTYTHGSTTRFEENSPQPLDFLRVNCVVRQCRCQIIAARYEDIGISILG